MQFLALIAMLAFVLAAPFCAYPQSQPPAPLMVGWLSQTAEARTECGSHFLTPPPTTKLPPRKPLTGVGEGSGETAMEYRREVRNSEEARKKELGCDAVLSGGRGPIESAVLMSGMLAKPRREVIMRVLGGADLDSLAASLVQQKVQLIVALGTPATVAAARATNSIPIVMVGVSDPVQLGLVASLARPGRNVTGVSFLAPELVEKSLQLLVDLQPRPTRVAVLWNGGNSGAELVLRWIQARAGALGLELLPVEARDRTAVPIALDTVKARRAEGLLVIADEVFARSKSRIVEFAARQRLPTAFQLKDYVEDGGLMSYGPSEEQIHKQAAGYVRKILQGIRPQDLPVEQPSEFQLVINLKTAKALGLTIPPSLLQRADQVIE